MLFEYWGLDNWNGVAGSNYIACGKWWGASPFCSDDSGATSSKEEHEDNDAGLDEDDEEKAEFGFRFKDLGLSGILG